MTQAPIDVLGIGNAIVDVISRADEAFLAKEALVKGTMALIDAERAEALYRIMGPGIEASGGSAGNTMAGIASLGGRGAYIGKVRDDLLGQVFRHDLTAQGVRFDTPAAAQRPRHGALPDPGHRRRAAHLEHLSRRLRRARARRYRPGTGRRRPNHLSRRLSVRPAIGAGGVPQGRRDRPWRRSSGGAVAVRPVLRRAPSRRVPRSGRRACRHPVRQRDRDLLAVPDRGFRRRGGRGARSCRDRGADPQRRRQPGADAGRTASWSRRRRWRGWSTPPGPAISTPAASSTA